MVATVKIFEVMTSTLPKRTLGSVASLLAPTLYQGHPGRNDMLWIIVLYAAGMLLHINGKFTMRKLKSSLLS